LYCWRSEFRKKRNGVREVKEKKQNKTDKVRKMISNKNLKIVKKKGNGEERKNK
jgi:hypothetical protein